MLNTAMHHPGLRMATCILGEFIAAFSLNYFIVPLGLYSGGSMGVCQLIRTLLQTWGGLSFGDHDIAGILYFLSNIPILLYAHKVLGQKFVLKTVICTAAFSLFYSVTPTPSVMLVDDTLTSCLLGGILSGIGSGLVLTCGGSGGGLGRHRPVPEQAGQPVHCRPHFSMTFKRLFVCRLSGAFYTGGGHLLRHLQFCHGFGDGQGPPAKHQRPGPDLYPGQGTGTGPGHSGQAGPGRYLVGGAWGPIPVRAST